MYDELPEDFWYDSIKFLKKNGYHIVRAPRDGDVVGYRFKKSPAAFFHWGIYRNGQVQSKFGRGNVYEHRIDLVPSHWGDDVIFFRKKNA